MKGKFISIEGGEGAGKSTALSSVRKWLDEQSIEYIVTREPGGTPMAEEIRKVVLKPRDESVSPKAELLLVFAARLQHLEQLIKPALDAGTWVISDRFLDSSYVYQGVARGLDESLIDNLVEQFLSDSLPDLTILLDVPVEVGVRRVVERGDLNRLDCESISFYDSVREGFLQRARTDKERIKVVDASCSISEVEGEIIDILEALPRSVGI